MTGGILALDLARVTGFAFASGAALKAWPAVRLGSAYPEIEYGRKVFPTDHGSPRLFAELGQWLGAEISDRAPALVIFEGPAIFRRIEPMQIRRANGMIAICEAVCYRRGVTVREAQPATIKKHWTGSGRAKKPAMMAEAKARGFFPTDDNVADALALLDYAAALLGYPDNVREAA